MQPEATFTRRLHHQVLDADAPGVGQLHRGLGSGWLPHMRAHRNNPQGDPQDWGWATGAPEEQTQWSIVSALLGAACSRSGNGEGGLARTIVVLGPSAPGGVAGRRDESLRRGCRRWQSSLCWGFGELLRHAAAASPAKADPGGAGEAAGLSPRSVSDLERGINRTARKGSAELLVGALGLAEPACGLFVAAARDRAQAAEVLAALRGPGQRPGVDRVSVSGSCALEEREARVFYGRGELADQLVQKLAARLEGTGILLVTGESGPGKSSLLRAG
jgi:hypothetical protein